jgi:limonene-1,2-epoxide hydrolase
MRTVTLQIDDATDEHLNELAQRCDATPGQFVDMLCASLDRETLARVIQHAIRDESVTSEPGIGRMPERRTVKSVG